LTTRSETVSECTEAELVARIQHHLPPAPDWLLTGIGDDAAVVDPERNRVEVLTVDAIVEGVHFDRAFVPPEAIGHRALAVNLSDVAAMGASPRVALLSMALPAALLLDDFDRIVTGLAALAQRYRVHVAGGNLTRSPGPLMIDVTLIGSVKRRQALLRSGAKPGDHVYLSGTIGAAAAGLGLLKEVVSRRSSVVSQQSPVTSQQSPVTSRESHLRDARAFERTTDDLRRATDDRRLMTAYLRPEPRVRLGVLLSRNRAAHACMDLSDGLTDAVHQIACASGVGMIIDWDALPIDPAARTWFEERGLDPLAAAMTAGDDYELLVVSHSRGGRRLAGVVRHAQTPLTRIGTCTEDTAIVVRSVREGATTVTPLPRGGYGHFR